MAKRKGLKIGLNYYSDILNKDKLDGVQCLEQYDQIIMKGYKSPPLIFKK